MTWTEATRQLGIALAPGSGRRGAMPRTFNVRVAGGQATRTLTFTGAPLSALL